MNKVVLKVAVAILISCNFFTVIGQQSLKPNIVFILADDFGYGSVNAYGADKNLVRTSHIDDLASAGMRFTRAHTPASICSPTRYGFLTGSYPWRSPMKFGVVDPDGALLPDPDKITIADILKNQGYNTAAIGKWHLGYGNKQPCDFTGKLTPGPLDLGFDYHFAVPQNHGDYWGVYIENDEIYGLRSKKAQPYSRTFYGPQYKGFDAPQRVNKDVMEVLTENSVNWLKMQSADTPFFLYFAAVAVHRPITPSDFMRGLSDCGPYGDFIQDVDLCVGRIIETIWDGGTNVPFIVSWPGMVQQQTVSDDLVNITDIFSTVADITGKGLPNDKEIAPDSFSFLPSLLKIKNDHPRKSMVTADSKGMHAIRLGDWKLIDNTAPFQLPEKIMNQYKNEISQFYNMKDDPAEQNNLFEKYPEKAKELLVELNRIRNASSSR